MLKFTGSALALLVAFSLMPLSQSVSADRGERHRIMKHLKMRMTDRSDHRRHRSVVRVVNRNVVVVKVGGTSRYRPYRQGNAYSGDVVIDVRSGVGQWSYGSYSADTATITVRSAPKVKIIDVGALKAGSACQMQAGVCVIKP